MDYVSCKDPTPTEQAAIVYSCQSCSFRSVRETSIRAHIIAIHASDGSYTLEKLRLMPKLNVTKAMIISSFNSHPNESTPSTVHHLSSPTESKSIRSPKQITIESATPRDGAPSPSTELYQCYFCSFSSSQPDEMETHVTSHDEQTAPPLIPPSCAVSNTLKDSVICVHCRISLPCPFSLAAHVRVCAKNSASTIDNAANAVASETDQQTPLQCSDCSFATNSRPLLDFHIYLLHSMHSCSECTQTFTSKRLLSTHLSSRHGHSCRRCNLSFASREQLDVHDDSVHLLGLTCTRCGLRLPTELALEEHESRHAALTCVCCNKMFDSSIELKTHLAQIHPRNNLLGGNSCDACFHAFCTPAALITHRTMCSVAAGSCSICGIAYGSPELLLDHVSKTHLDVAILECPLCAFRTIDQTVHITHQLVHVALPPPRSVSSSRAYQCGICERWTASTSSLRTHVNNHHRLKPYRCEFCEFCTSSCGNLRAHRAVRHLNTELSVKCDVCNRRYRTVAQMHKHVKKTHEQKLNYECEFCENRFVTELRLKRHLAIVHFEDAEAITGAEPYAGITRFRCDECGYSSYSTNRFRLHRSTHRERLKCPYCDLSFPLVDVLNRHINAKHLKRHVSCTICGRRLPNESKLAHHIESCHAEDVEPFTCESCGYFFESLAHLEYHRRSHLTAKNFECLTCRRSFTTATSLCVHRLRHAKVESRPRAGKRFVGNTDWLFQCEQCKLRFKYKSNLVAHQTAVHSLNGNESSAEKLFTCDYCRKAKFSSKLLLSYHVRRKHLEGRTLSCEHCEKTFHSQSSLNNHVVSVHTKAYKIFCPLCDKGMLSSLRLRLHVLHAHKNGKRKRVRKSQRLTAEGAVVNEIVQLHENQQPIIDADENDLLTQEIVISSVDVDHGNVRIEKATRGEKPLDQMPVSAVASEATDCVDIREEDTIESAVEISDDPTSDLISQIILHGSTGEASCSDETGLPERTIARAEPVHMTVDHTAQLRNDAAEKLARIGVAIDESSSTATHSIAEVIDLARYVTMADHYKPE